MKLVFVAVAVAVAVATRCWINRGLLKKFAFIFFVVGFF